MNAADKTVDLPPVKLHTYARVSSGNDSQEQSIPE